MPATSARPPPKSTQKKSTKDIRTPTDIPGVFRNSNGYMTDQHGVLLGLRDVNKRELGVLTDLIEGNSFSPLQMLTAAMNDPRLPRTARYEFAAKAAPYVHSKMPLRIENPNDNKPSMVLDIAALSKLSRSERESLLATLEKLGVKL